MAPAKRASSGALQGFRFNQPFVGFRTAIRSKALKQSGKWQTHTVNYGGSCREEVIWDTREYLQERAVTWYRDDSSWRKNAKLNAGLDLDDTSLKQPGVTYFWLNVSDEDDWNGSHYGSVCRRPCCIGRFPELMDAFVGPLAVVLNPDRYSGNWWITLPGEVAPKPKSSYYGEEYRWYGSDNFFLRHPVLTSIMLGMFRQGVLLFEQGFDEAVLRAVRRSDVERALSDPDPELALRLLTRLRPWVEVPYKTHKAHYPFPSGQWSRVRQLHRAIFNHGYEKLFDGGLNKAWNIAGSQKNGGDPWNQRYDISTGPMTYWGSKSLTAAGKRLVKLGR